MKYLILYRGFHYKKGDGSDVGLRSRDRLRNSLPFSLDMLQDNHRQHIIEPLRQRGEVKIVGITYDSPDIDRLSADFDHEAIDIIDPANSSQLSTLNRGIHFALRHAAKIGYIFDWLIILRYDLIYVPSIGTWPVKWHKKDAIYVPFLCKQHRPQHTMVSDCVFCIPSNKLPEFMHQCYVNRHATHNHHFIVPFKCMYGGRYDANTTIQRNPLYVMAGRPIAED
jgi:hypothetical protein